MSIDYLVSRCESHKDCGCEDISHCCLSCPLSFCRFESPGGIRSIRNAERNPKIKAMEGVIPVDVVAGLFEMSPTNVHRIWRSDPMGVDKL